MQVILEAVCTALQEAGLRARADLPARQAGTLTEPLAAVRLARENASEAAIGGYLGTIDDPERGEVPLYGRRLEGELEVTLFAPDTAAQCEQAARTAQQALLALDNPRLGVLETGPAAWDDETGCFTLALRGSFSAWLYAVQTGDEPVFTDFTLLPTIFTKGSD